MFGFADKSLIPEGVITPVCTVCTGCTGWAGLFIFCIKFCNPPFLSWSWSMVICWVVPSAFRSVTTMGCPCLAVLSLNPGWNCGDCCCESWLAGISILPAGVCGVLSSFTLWPGGDLIVVGTSTFWVSWVLLVSVTAWFWGLTGVVVDWSRDAILGGLVSFVTMMFSAFLGFPFLLCTTTGIGAGCCGDSSIVACFCGDVSIVMPPFCGEVTGMSMGTFLPTGTWPADCCCCLSRAAAVSISCTLLCCTGCGLFSFVTVTFSGEGGVSVILEPVDILVSIKFSDIIPVAAS